MNENTLLKRFFEDGIEFDPDKQFGLSHKVRIRRIREIVLLMRKHHVMDGLSPTELRDILVDLGPSFIKIGQMLSLRSEILPQAYCDALSDLQMDCDPMPFDETVAVLRGIYGDKFDAIFKEIDPKPLGSASMAQVHRAVLTNGDEAAVKVQRPGVRTTMAQDIDVMRAVAKQASRFMKDNQMLNLRDVVEELWVTFLEETDFLKEARNLEEFALLNKDVVYISCPKPYMEYCTEEVLVMEYVDGISIRDTKRLLENGYDLEEIGVKVMDNYATQIMEHGFFHADPHPGNILVKDGKVIYIDLGIMGRLSVRDRGGFKRIVEAVGSKNSAELKDALITFSVSIIRASWRSSITFWKATVQPTLPILILVLCWVTSWCLRASARLPCPLRLPLFRVASLPWRARCRIVWQMPILSTSSMDIFNVLKTSRRRSRIKQEIC